MSSTTISAPQQGDKQTRTAAPKPSNRGMWLPYLGIALIIIYCLAPFYWMITSALRRPNDTFSTRIFPAPASKLVIWPKAWSKTHEMT